MYNNYGRTGTDFMPPPFSHKVKSWIGCTKEKKAES